MYGLAMDVSNLNPASEKIVRDSKSKMLIAKGTEGSDYDDKYLTPHREIAHKLHIAFGVYCFLHAAAPGDEAKHFLQYVKPKKSDIVIIDSEEGGKDGKGVAALARRTLSCAEELTAAGHKPLIYADTSTWKQMVGIVPALKKFKIWEAQYPGRFARWFPRLAKLRIKLMHGVTVVMWQWTDYFAVDGKHYDMSIMYTAPKNMH